MNDNTNTPATPNELLSENHDLLYKLLAVIENHVNELVERKVVQIMESHAAMLLINQKMEEKLTEIARDMLDEHEADYDHPSNDDVSDLVATHINHYNFNDQVKRSVEEIMSDGDYATEERVEELVQEHISDIDVEEKVKEVLRNI